MSDELILISVTLVVLLLLGSLMTYRLGIQFRLHQLNTFWFPSSGLPLLNFFRQLSGPERTMHYFEHQVIKISIKGQETDLNIVQN